MTGEAGVARTLRLGLLGLAALSVLAIAYELFAEKHWNSAVQLIPWFVLVVLAAAIALAFAARRVPVAAARALAVVALLASGFGIYEHVSENYANGELDASYSSSWETMSPTSKFLLAVTKTVGANPPIAPGALGQAGLLVLLATVGRGRRAPVDA